MDSIQKIQLETMIHDVANNMFWDASIVSMNFIEIIIEWETSPSGQGLSQRCLLPTEIFAKNFTVKVAFKHDILTIENIYIKIFPKEE